MRTVVRVGLGEGQRLEGDVGAGLLEEEVDVVEGVGGGQLGDSADDDLGHLVQALEPAPRIRRATGAQGLSVQELGLSQYVVQLLYDRQPARKEHVNTRHTSDLR